MAIQLLRSALARAREMLQRHRIDRELDEELRLHLDLEVEHNIARGMSPADARRATAMAFGGVQRFREETSDARGFVAVDRLLRELRLTARRMRRAPTFAAGVIATLAIGLGASAGIGALVYAVMLRPLSYTDPDRLVRVSVSTPGLGTTTTEHSNGTFVYFSERARSFAEVGGYFENDGVAITEGDKPEQVKAAMVTPNIFAILGTRPALGRLFRDADGVADMVPVMISYELWQRRFGGDSGVVGKRIELNRGSRAIVGVLPRGFDFPSATTAVYYANSIGAKRANLGSRYITVVSRLRPGVTATAAAAELNSLIPHFHERFPDLSAEAVQQSGLRAGVRTLREAIVEPVRAELTLLAVMVGLVLLIATANVATLFLLRADRLRGEVAVSRALGASRTAMTQRFVVEGIVVALCGAMAALPIVALALSTKFGFTAGQIPRLHEVAMNGVSPRSYSASPWWSARY